MKSFSHHAMMSQLLVFVLLLVLNGASLGRKESNDHHLNSTCPTWTSYDNSTHSCKCGANLYQIVSCIDVGECPVSVLFGFCMTLNEDQTKVVVGSCPFTFPRYPKSMLRYTVPNNSFQLDKFFCGSIKRTGQLCAQCVNETKDIGNQNSESFQVLKSTIL